jgi:hypothetical protein
MGMSMEFFAGDPIAIGEAFNTKDRKKVEDASTAHADLSLNLAAEDLELLTMEVGFLLECGLPTFRELCVERIAGDGKNRSAFVVAEKWVYAMASVPESWSGDLAWAWASWIADERGERNVEVSDGIVSAARQLTNLCRIAESQSSRVIYSWTS